MVLSSCSTHPGRRRSFMGFWGLIHGKITVPIPHLDEPFLVMFFVLRSKVNFDSGSGLTMLFCSCGISASKLQVQCDASPSEGAAPTPASETPSGKARLSLQQPLMFDVPLIWHAMAAPALSSCVARFLVTVHWCSAQAVSVKPESAPESASVGGYRGISSEEDLSQG